MQTNTKVKQQPKKMSFVLTLELMVLSIIVGATALRGTVTIEPVNKGNTEMFTNKFSNSDLDNATIESNTLNYAQNIDEQSAQSGTQGLNN